MSIKDKIMNIVSEHPKLVTFGIGLVITFAIGAVIGMAGHQQVFGGPIDVGGGGGHP